MPTRRTADRTLDPGRTESSRRTPGWWAWFVAVLGAGLLEPVNDVAVGVAGLVCVSGTGSFWASPPTPALGTGLYRDDILLRVPA